MRIPLVPPLVVDIKVVYIGPNKTRPVGSAIKPAVLAQTQHTELV